MKVVDRRYYRHGNVSVYLEGYQRPRRNNIDCVVEDTINSNGNNHDICGIIYSGGEDNNDRGEELLS